MYAELRSQAPILKMRYQARVTHVNRGAPWVTARQGTAVDPLQVESMKFSVLADPKDSQRIYVRERSYALGAADSDERPSQNSVLSARRSTIDNPHNSIRKAQTFSEVSPLDETQRSRYRPLVRWTARY